MTKKNLPGAQTTSIVRSRCFLRWRPAEFLRLHCFGPKATKLEDLKENNEQCWMERNRTDAWYYMIRNFNFSMSRNTNVNSNSMDVVSACGVILTMGFHPKSPWQPTPLMYRLCAWGPGRGFLHIKKGLRQSIKEEPQASDSRKRGTSDVSQAFTASRQPLPSKKILFLY